MSQKTLLNRIVLGNGTGPSDEELMRNYQEGDQVAFEILFERYSGRVLGFLSKRLSQPQSAHELTQDVFLKLHRSRGQYRGNLPFAPWLFSITRNVWIDHIKKNRKEDPTDQDFLEKLAPIPEPTVESQNEILKQLVPNQKTAVAMKIYDDATFEEIAARLDTTSENARQLFSRGIRRLKELMGLKKD